MPTQVGLAMKSSRNAYILFYALAFLIGVAYFGMSGLHHDEISLDWTTNSYSKYQSNLYIQSISKMINLCLEKYNFQDCHSDKFFLDNATATYHLVADENGRYWADIDIEKINLRTSQMLRTRIKIPLKTKNAR